jgi:serine/threonine-protein kinase
MVRCYHPEVLGGRYRVCDEIAAGGMATVHLGCLVGPASFSRVVALKRLHPHLARSSDFRTMLLDEARLAARVDHPNVVRTIEVVEDGDDVAIVMDHVLGVSLAAALADAREKMPVDVAAGIVIGVLHGLHAAHEATGADGSPLGIVHRDVSPENVLIGVDGTPRLVDFGIAKARSRLTSTEDGTTKGKRGYMAPEQLLGDAVGRETDVFGAGVVLWEALAGARLFPSDEGRGALARRVADDVTARVSELRDDVPRALDEAILRALALAPPSRFATARAMADEIAAIVTPASRERIASWLDDVSGRTIELLSERVRRVESTAASGADVARVTGVASTPAARAASKRRFAIGALLAAAVASTLAILGTRLTRLDAAAAEPQRVQAAIPATAPLGSTAPAPASPPAATEAATAEVAPSQVPAPSAVVAAATRTATTLASSSRTPITPVPRAGGRASTSAKARCSPPFTFDDAGRKIFKAECF